MSWRNQKNNPPTTFTSPFPCAGAVFVEGTTGLSIDGCQFERLDGNAIMLSGYNRAASVTNSHFAWTGGTAIAAWGRTDEMSDAGVHGWDATAGDIPQGTVITDNIMRESGIWEKQVSAITLCLLRHQTVLHFNTALLSLQSSCFFQAKTAGSILNNNLCFNLPRGI